MIIKVGPALVWAAIKRIIEFLVRSCPLERYERDARAAAKHLAMSSAIYIIGGKLVLGQDLSQARF